MSPYTFMRATNHIPPPWETPSCTSYPCLIPCICTKLPYALTMPLQNCTSLLPKTTPKINHVYLQKQHHFTSKTAPFYLQNYTSLLPKTSPKISHVNLTILSPKQHHFTSKTAPLYSQKQHQKSAMFTSKNSTILSPKQHLKPSSWISFHHKNVMKTAPPNSTTFSYENST